MGWQKNLSKLIDESGYTNLEIYAHTNIPVATISNISNEKHKYLTCEQFILFRLLLKETHEGLLNKLFGKDYFSKIKKIDQNVNLTEFGVYFRDKHNYEVFPKKKLVDATGLVSSRIDYLFNNSYDNIRIDEITKFEIVAGKKIGTLCNMFFSKVNLNSTDEYNRLIKEQREINKQANDRRKKTGRQIKD